MAVSLRASGLKTFEQELTTAEGSLEVADNVVIDRDDSIQPRRGFDTYGIAAQGAVKQLLSYKNTLLRHYSTNTGNRLAYDSDGQGTFVDFEEEFSSGAFDVTSPTAYRIKSASANNNIYITTAAGIKKVGETSKENISVKSLVRSGVPRALGINLSVDNSKSGILPLEAKVGYRITWGIKDNNSNEIQGFPSNFTEVSLRGVNQLARDFNNICNSLNTVSTNPPSDGLNGTNFLSYRVDENISAVGLYDRIVELLLEISYDLDGGVSASSTPQYLWATDKVPSAFKDKLETVSAIEVHGDVCYLRFRDTLDNINSGGIVTGQSIAVYGAPTPVTSINGIKSLAAIGSLPLTFTAQDASGSATAFSTVTAITFSSPTVSLQFKNSGGVSQISSRAAVGQRIEITNSSINGLNGTHVITTVGVDSLSIAVTGTFTAGPASMDVALTEQPLSAARTLAFAVSDLPSIVSIARTGITVANFSSYLAIERPTRPNEDGSYIQADISGMQDWIDLIVSQLVSEPSTVMDIGSVDFKLATRSAEVSFTVDIPPGITNTKYFYQVYRTPVRTASPELNLDNVVLSDELKLAYEGSITDAELTAKVTNVVVDIATDSFVGANANLYTNQNTGGGIQSANSEPPVCGDIATFKNHLFGANLKFPYTINTTLIATENLSPTRTLLVGQQQYSFVEPWAKTDITFVGTPVTPTPPAPYSTLVIQGVDSNNSSAQDYTFVFRTGSTAVATNQYTIQVDVRNQTTPSQLAIKLAEAISASAATAFDVVHDGTSSSLTIINKNYSSSSFVGQHVSVGVAWAGAPTITPVRTGGTFSPSTNKVLLYKDSTFSIGQRIDLTARSIVEAINKSSTNGSLVAYYNSSGNTQPGFIQIAERSFNLVGPFNLYLSYQTDDATTAIPVFNPSINALRQIASVSSVASSGGFTVTVTASSSIGSIVTVGSTILVNTPLFRESVRVLSKPNATSFTFFSTTSVTASSGDFGVFDRATNTELKNGIAFSKPDEPEAFPTAQVFRVGSSDKTIDRIIPLRDALIIFKGDEGIFRLLGNNVNDFTVSLFDSSSLILAPDSAVVLNNQIFVLTSQGIAIVTDTGVQIASRNIEDKVLKAVQGDMSLVHGVGYESDRSYLIWLPDNINSTTAEQCLRYNTFTKTWTRWPIAKTCAIVEDDRMYLGATEDGFIEKEKKGFTRKDYSDREIADNIIEFKYFPDQSTVILPGALKYSAGDVIVQDQYLTINRFNNTLRKLSADSNVSAVLGAPLNIAAFEAENGSNIGTKLNLLIIYLGTNGVITSPPSIVALTTAEEIRDKYLELTARLNDISSATLYKNYASSLTLVEQETSILSVSYVDNVCIIRYTTPFLIGPCKIHKAIKCDVVYNPSTFGDPSVLKHVREGTLIFEELYITNGLVKYASDLKPAFTKIPFSGLGTGAWGLFNWGDASWGGNGPEIPIRTLLPLDQQRCRFLRCGFEHRTAREHFTFFGFSLELNAGSVSSRGYRGVS